MKPGRTGSEGCPWVQLQRPKPPRIVDEMQYWSTEPPQPSPRCIYWVKQIERGWLPNRRISMNGYHPAAIWYGVFIWEYLNVIAPMVEAKRQKAVTAA